MNVIYVNIGKDIRNKGLIIMKIIVDADACPVKDIIEDLARKSEIELILVSNTSHRLSSTYARTIMVDKSAEAADIAIVNLCRPGDIVITQDYGLASMVLAKKAAAIHPLGTIYNYDNMDTLLMQRFIGQKARKAGLKTRGPKKRTGEDSERFRKNLLVLLELYK